MNKALVGGILAVVVVVAAVLLMNNNATAPTNDDQVVTPTPTPNPTTSPNPTSPEPTPTSPNPNPTTPNPNPTTPPAATPKTHDISMTDSAYSPSTLTIKKGDTVKFTNNGTRLNWPASAPHPSHTDYPAFDPKQGIAVGQSWSFTFDRVGTWRFHDHLNATRFGSITVTE